MNLPASSPPQEIRARRTVSCVVEHDRRTWGRLVRQAAAEERWICDAIRKLIHGKRPKPRG